MAPTARLRRVALVLVIVVLVALDGGCSDDDTPQAGPTVTSTTAAAVTTLGGDGTVGDGTVGDGKVVVPPTSTAPDTPTVPETAAPSAPVPDPALQYVGLEHTGDQGLPTGVTEYGGAILGPGPELTHGVAVLGGPDGAMFWLEELLGYDGDLPQWRVVAAVSEPTLTLPGGSADGPWPFLADGACTVDGVDTDGVIAVFVGVSPEDTVSDPLAAYLVRTDPPAFEPLDGDITCPNPGAGV